MDTGISKRVPWKSWSDFIGWAQDFSLRQKVLGGFLGAVILVGLATSLAGTRLARQTIINTARISLHSNLAAAAYVLKQSQQSLDLKIRLMADSPRFASLTSGSDREDLLEPPPSELPGSSAGYPPCRGGEHPGRRSVQSSGESPEIRFAIGSQGGDGGQVPGSGG